MDDLHALRPAVEPAASPYRGGDAHDRDEWAKLCNLQRRLLAAEAPPAAGYRLALRYRPSFVVTGDYHDFFPRPDGNLGVFVGDGSGHGPAAGMLMATMRALLATHAGLHAHRSPGLTLLEASRLFHRLVPDDLFMTGVYMVLHHGGVVDWAAAGHHPPLWVKRSGEAVPADLTPIGAVLGYETEREYDVVRFRLGVGDRVLAFTDGLWDARNRAGEPFTRLRLWQHMQFTMDDPLADAVASIVAAATEHVRGAEFEDDFTVLGIERAE